MKLSGVPDETALNPANVPDKCYSCHQNIAIGEPFEMHENFIGWRRHKDCPETLRDE